MLKHIAFGIPLVPRRAAGASRDSLLCASVVPPLARPGIPFSALRSSRRWRFSGFPSLRFGHALVAAATLLLGTGSALAQGASLTTDAPASSSVLSFLALGF